MKFVINFSRKEFYSEKFLYKIPDQIEFIEEWPKTKIGKIDINRLREKVTIK